MVGLTACVSAPVQEMSDARQAIRAAEAAGAERYAPEPLQKAHQLLERAQRRLEAGSYFDARHYALEARDSAIQAQEAAGAVAPSSAATPGGPDALTE